MDVIYVHGLSTLWIFYTVFSRTNALEVDIKLVDGQSINQGKVMVRSKPGVNAAWKPVCAKNFNNVAAAVVCRQLGYRYSLNEPDVFQPTIPYWILDDLFCYGNESNFGKCFRGKHNCYREEDSYAAVCCSNSPEFGEWTRGDTFKSHCGDTWLGAQKQCEKHDSRIDIINSEQARDIGVVNQGYIWSGQFITPWIWSNDCVNETKEFVSSYTDNFIANNSPGLCFQMCGHRKGTRFILSGAICRCIRGRHYLDPVRPQFCHSKCPGNLNKYCGDGNQQYWDLYFIGSKDDEFEVYSTFSNETKQCAGLIQKPNGKNKLQSRNCDQQAGYICSDFQSKLKRMHTPFFSSLDHFSAKHACRNITSGEWKLAGRDVLKATFFATLPDGMWVDIESSLVPVLDLRGFKASSYIDPDLCLSVNTARSNTSELKFKIVDCRKQRLLFVCAKTSFSGSTRRTDSANTDKTTDSIIVDEMTEETKQTRNQPNNTIKQMEIWQISLAVLAGIILAIVFVIIIFCWKKRKRHSRPTTSDGGEGTDDQTTAQYYSVLDTSCRSRTSGEYEVVSQTPDTDGNPSLALQPLNSVYEELPEEDSYHYLQLEAEHPDLTTRKETEDNGEDVVTVVKKESLKLKTSYATPQDSVRDKPNVKRYDSYAGDPKYSFPYDSVEQYKCNGAITSGETILEDLDKSKEVNTANVST